ncbi:hypothetical protein GQ53DRAFT_223403 [Thozetella sp. PMI_491]|nr:hypothetical protein GQ53DRAFT_223403 [Thozetella sp. PMI_491]
MPLTSYEVAWFSGGPAIFLRIIFIFFLLVLIGGSTRDKREGSDRVLGRALMAIPIYARRDSCLFHRAARRQEVALVASAICRCGFSSRKHGCLPAPSPLEPAVTGSLLLRSVGIANVIRAFRGSGRSSLSTTQGHSLPRPLCKKDRLARTAPSAEGIHRVSPTPRHSSASPSFSCQSVVIPLFASPSKPSPPGFHPAQPSPQKPTSFVVTLSFRPYDPPSYLPFLLGPLPLGPSL